MMNEIILYIKILIIYNIVINHFSKNQDINVEI